ncbi:MAG: response regulator transcription factor [Solirubrobacterales bacterium]|nr:response regulator transcription factor [Solirubrobacterales bacterium]
MTITIAIADDQPLVRAGLRMIIDAAADMRLVAEAPDGRQAVDVARRVRPDLMLMDIRMPVLDGIEATRQISAGLTRAPRIVMLTTFDLDEYVYGALQAGASGFLLKDVGPEQLIDGIRTVARGDSLLAPSITTRLIQTVVQAKDHAPIPPAIDELTPRELEIFGLVARGLSNAEIADQLVLSSATVKTHVTRILTKLGLRDRVQAVVLAYETALVKPGRIPMTPG